MAPMNSQLRLELAQFRPRKGRVDENLGRMKEWIERCRGTTDLLVFPECSPSGYFVEGAAAEVALSVSELARAFGPAGEDSPEVVAGFYERGDGPTYNSVAWFSPVDGAYVPRHLHRKVFLPTYGVFDEARFISPGSDIGAFDTRFGRVGMLVCEEMLHSLVPAALALDGAELLVVVAASPVRGFRPGPGLPGNLERWELAGRAAALEHGLHVVIAQLAGSEGGKILAGGSSVFLPGGEVGGRGPLFQEGSHRATLDRTKVRRHRSRHPLLSDLEARTPHLLEALTRISLGLPGSGGRNGDPRSPLRGRGSPSGETASKTPADRGGGTGPDGDDGSPAGGIAAPEGGAALGEGRLAVPDSGLPDPADSTVLELDLEMVESALVGFLRDEIRVRRGFRDVVVGVSGGVDSAVSLFLAARALGSDHVHAFLLPYATSSPASLEDGKRVLEAAGVEGRTIEITPAVDGYIEEVEPDASGLRRGNVAARVRSMVLWDQSAKLSALPLGTGNKSERLLGYFTWHADDSPPINPLGDLFKTQVWALARHLGVPAEVIDKAPSADLVEGVHDEDEIGVAYPVADRILYWLLEGFRPDDLVRAGFPAEAVEKVRSRLEGTHWKRELPTVAALSESAIGEFYLRPVDY